MQQASVPLEIGFGVVWSSHLMAVLTDAVLEFWHASPSGKNSAVRTLFMPMKNEL
jgi:hypothetical protein